MIHDDPEWRPRAIRADQITCTAYADGDDLVVDLTSSAFGARTVVATRRVVTRERSPAAVLRCGAEALRILADAWDRTATDLDAAAKAAKPPGEGPP